MASFTSISPPGSFLTDPFPLQTVTPGTRWTDRHGTRLVIKITNTDEVIFVSAHGTRDALRQRCTVKAWCEWAAGATKELK